MKRCQKAAYGYKGQLTGDNLFAEVDELQMALNYEPRMVETKKHPGVKVPGWFLIITPVSSRWGSSGGVNKVDFTIYVNDDELLTDLDAMQEGAAPLEVITPTATTSALARLMSIAPVPSIPDDLESSE